MCCCFKILKTPAAAAAAAVCVCVCMCVCVSGELTLKGFRSNFLCVFLFFSQAGLSTRNPRVSD